MQVILILMLAGLLLSSGGVSKEQSEGKANPQEKTSVEKIAIPEDWPLEKTFNPEGENWIVVIDRETVQFVRSAMRNYGVSKVRGFGLGGAMSEAEPLIQSGYPSIVTFSPDQKPLERIRKYLQEYHYLFILPMSEIKRVLAEDKCIIVSRLDGESYRNLIAAPDKESLKKAFVRFFSLEEIPLEPIIFKV